MGQVADQIDLKVDERIADIRQKMNARLDELSNGRQKEVVGKIVQLSDQLQNHQREVAQQMNQQN